MSQLLRQSDTLELTGVQADSLASMNRRYTVRLDSIWSGWRRTGRAAGDLRPGRRVRRYKHAREASVDLLIALAPTINDLLTAEQKRKLPPLVASHLDTRYLAGIRSGTAGNTGGGVFMPGMMMGGGGEEEASASSFVDREDIESTTSRRRSVAGIPSDGGTRRRFTTHRTPHLVRSALHLLIP